MSLSVCPAAVVDAPCAGVWEMLMNLPSDTRWLDAEMQRVEPPGSLRPGQTLWLAPRGLGRQWPVTIYVEQVDAARLAIDLQVALPLGMINHEHLTCAPVSETACRVQFG